jgi:four helix bundle protein
MPNKAPSPNDKKKYDLEERTAQFGEATIELVKMVPKDPISSPLISQIVRAATSVGADYVEAQMGQSQRGISSTKSRSAKRNLRRQGTGSG